MALYLPASDGTFFDPSLDRIVPRSLDDLMGLSDLPIRVTWNGTIHTDGGLFDMPDALYGDSDSDLHTEAGEAGWDLLTGYSGQHGYNGPVMHASEFVGGGLARDILAEPGVYVAITVENLDDPDNPSGWVVLRKR